MNEVIRPKWLESDVILLGFLIVVALVVIVVFGVIPVIGISIPAVGFFVAIWMGKLVGKILGEDGARHRLVIASGIVVYVVVPDALQLFYTWQVGYEYFILPCSIMNGLCYWFGVKLGQHDEVRSIAMARRILQGS